MLTPMSKYNCSEMAIRTASDAIQVMGGSGYMKDYPAERYLRDARITNIYEGTSQLQIVAAIRGLTSGVYQNYLADFEAKTYDDADLEALKARLVAAREELSGAIAFAKEQGGVYVDLAARKLVDCGIDILIGHYFLGQATKCDRKKKVARYFVETRLPRMAMNCAAVKAANTQAMDDYLTFVGPAEE